MAVHSDCENIALVGYRGVGKSTVAQQLARRLSWEWVDADVEAERRAGKSIAAIFADDGEEAFRDLESQVVAELCRRRRTILALGGGAVLREANQAQLRQCGAVVWLRASVDAIVQRLDEDPASPERRPNLTSTGGRAEVERLLEVRTPIYRACATLEVDTEGMNPSEIVDAIVAALGLSRKR